MVKEEEHLFLITQEGCVIADTIKISYWVGPTPPQKFVENEVKLWFRETKWYAEWENDFFFTKENAIPMPPHTPLFMGNYCQSLLASNFN